MALTKYACIAEAQRIATLKRSAARKERDNKGAAIGVLWKERLAEIKLQNDTLHIDRQNEYKEDLAEINSWLQNEIAACSA